MDPLLTKLIAHLPLTGSIPQDAKAFLAYHQYLHTIEHSARVAAAAHQLAKRYNADPLAASDAGWLHDISAVIPNSERIHYAESWRIDLFPEERQAPMIVHQKLSAHLAQHLFHITNPAVLSAIRCHTTLRPGASRLDKIVFLADKLEWDGAGASPCKADLEAALQHSTDAATKCYLSYLWQRRDTLLVIHPWFAAAYAEVTANDTNL